MSQKTGTIYDYMGYSYFEDSEDIRDVIGDLNEPVVAHSVSAQYDYGVTYFAPWEDPYQGFPEHARRCARAMFEARMPTHLRSLDPTNQWNIDTEGSKIRSQYKNLLDCGIKNHIVFIYQVVPNDSVLRIITSHATMDPDVLRKFNERKIVYTVWERDRASRHMIEYMSKVGQCWVANNQDARMLEDCGIEKSKIRVIPVPFFKEDPLLSLRGPKKRSGPPRFYHIGKWEPRKEQRNIMRAFMMAFKPGEATLSMKVTKLSTPISEYPQSLIHAVHELVKEKEIELNGWTIEIVPQYIHNIVERLPAKKIFNLHRINDIYVTLSRGEGFDMPAFDAALAGNLMIFTPSGGPQDFAHPNDLCVKKTGMVPCHEFYQWEKDAQYMDYDIMDVVVKMRQAAKLVRDQYRHEKELGRLEEFSSRNVGKKMVSCVKEFESAEQQTGKNTDSHPIG